MVAFSPNFGRLLIKNTYGRKSARRSIGYLFVVLSSSKHLLDVSSKHVTLMGGRVINSSAKEDGGLEESSC